MKGHTAEVSGVATKVVLDQALAALNRGDSFIAESLLQQLLEQKPADASALQLLGVLRREQGRFDEAERLYRQSLVAKPDQAHVHHNLGNLLRTLNRLDEAIAEQQEAIRLNRGYVNAHYSLGLGLSDKGDLAGAEKALRTALRIQPNFMIAKQVLASVLNDQERFVEAETLMRRAIALKDNNSRQVAAFEHNLAVAVLQQGRPAEALEILNAAQAKVPEIPLVDYVRGNALQQLGQLEEAVQSYRHAIARNSLDVLAHRDLNHLLYRLGNDHQLLRSYDEALALHPNEGLLHLAKASFLHQAGRLDEALEEFERAAVAMPAHVTARDAIGMVCAQRGDFERAITEHETAVKMEPNNAGAWRNFAQTLVRFGDAKKAVEIARKALAIEPTDQGALATMGSGLAAIGDAQAEELNNFDQFIRVFELEPPSDYGSVEEFNQELSSYLDNLHHDKREFLAQSLRGGTQTLEALFGRGHKLVEQLRIRIDEAVKTYISDMKVDDRHPFLSRRSNGFRYAGSWSSRLRDSGFHANHIHASGWISSAYYVSVPDVVADTGEKQGWLKFGEPPFESGIKDPIRRTVQPQLGRLVLFPSYMWHGTVPFRSTQTRTTVAFDVTPKNA
jgi:tetratricopeptide (TPR) repeat protein